MLWVSRTQDRWVYFFKECTQSNDKLLYKLTQYEPLKRWINLFSVEFIEDIIPEIQDKDVTNLLNFTKARKEDKIRNLANRMYTKIGYANK